VPCAGQRSREESARPPAVLPALLASAGAAGLALCELWLPLPELHRGLALLVALLSAMSVVLLVGWRRREGRLRRERCTADADRELQAKALAHLYDALVITDADFRIRAWNRAAERLYGYSCAEVLGKALGEVFETELSGGGGTEELLERVQQEGRVQIDGRRRRKDGSWVEVRLLVNRVADARGRALAYIGVHRDMTEEREHEEAIRTAEAQIQLLTSRAPAGIFQYDQSEKLVFLNEMLCVMTGLPPERLLGEGWLQAVHPADQRRVVAAWRSAMSGGAVFRAEFRIGVDGEPAWVHATAMQIRDDVGKPTGVVGVMTDVSESRRLKEQLGKAERMASLGTLATGMAHEVNNPLACVTSSLAFAAGEVAGKGELREVSEALADAQHAAQRVACIIRELHAFAETREEVAWVDLGEAARDALQLLPEALRRSAVAEVEAPGAPAARVSRQQLQRVLTKLLENAFQAIPEHRAGAGKVRVAARSVAEGRVLLDVEDDGRGIPAEQQARIFDPFYTTRQAGQGTGLGLAVCHALVNAMGGEIEVESEVGRGTRFRLLLPSAGAPAAGAAASAAARQAAF